MSAANTDHGRAEAWELLTEWTASESLRGNGSRSPGPDRGRTGRAAGALFDHRAAA